jgi:hypothetical protein
MSIVPVAPAAPVRSSLLGAWLLIRDTEGSFVSG